MLRRLHHLLGSLKARLALASLVLIAASVALTVVLVLRAMEQRGLRATLDAEIATTEGLASVLSTKLVSLQNAMREASRGLPTDRLADSAALVAYLHDQAVLRSLFDTVFVASPQGRLLAVGDARGVRPVDIDASDRTYFQRTLRDRRPIISPPGFARTTGEAMFAMTMPVFDRAGRLSALLVCGTRLDDNALLSDLTRQPAGEVNPVTTIVVDAAGNIMSHPEPGWLMKDARTEPRFSAVFRQWTDEGRPIDPQASARRLGDDIVAIAGVPDADWLVLRSAPAEVLLGGPSAGRRQGVLIGAAVAVAGGLITLLVTLAMLRPLRRLERRALRLLTDDLADEEGWPRVGGELGELTRAFRHVMQQRAAIQASGEDLLGMMQAVMARAPVGIAFSRNGQFELVSDEFARMFGYGGDTARGLSTHALCVSDEAYESFVKRAYAGFADGRGCDEERELKRADGSRLWARLQGAPVRGGDGRAGGIWIFTDITESRRHREQLSWAASHDELTALSNRREFELRLAEHLGRRADAQPSAALFIDLDRFKAVNDDAGHAAGDAVLRGIAAIFVGRARADDTVARIGGDEFAILLPGCGRDAAVRIADDLCRRVAEYRLDRDDRSLGVGASIGVVEIDPGFGSVEEVLEAADAACYEAKRAGRNAVRVHGEGMAANLRDGASPLAQPAGGLAQVPALDSTPPG